MPTRFEELRYRPAKRILAHYNRRYERHSKDAVDKEVLFRKNRSLISPSQRHARPQGFVAGFFIPFIPGKAVDYSGFDSMDAATEFTPVPLLRGA